MYPALRGFAYLGYSVDPVEPFLGWGKREALTSMRNPSSPKFKAKYTNVLGYNLLIHTNFHIRKNCPLYELVTQIYIGYF